MTRLLAHVRHNAIAYLALFVALGGTSYAAVSLPAGSVGTRQLKNHSITPVKLKSSAIAGSVRAWAIVDANGHVVASGGRPRVEVLTSLPGAYILRWGVVLPDRCSAQATVDGQLSQETETVPIMGGDAELAAGFATETGTFTRFDKSSTSVQTYNQTGAPTPLAFDVAVIC